MTGVVDTAAAALAAGYLLGRLRPWQRLSGAADQARVSGPHDGVAPPGW